MAAIGPVLAVLGALLLAACGEEPAAPPPPERLTSEATGVYCGMTVRDHKGPKGQIFLADSDKALWFTSVRDAVAFTMLPGEPKNIRAIYVNDMGVAGNWDAPPYESWIPAKSAFYVIESSKRGGMGAPEAVPFGARAKADAFVARYGGRVVTWDKIPTDYILSGGDAGPPHRPAAADRHPDNQHPGNQHPDNQHKEGTRQ